MNSEVAAGAGPLWVSLEGINGVGKTTAARSAAAGLGAECVLLDELTDSCGDILHGRVIAAPSEQGDPFLRTGHPVVETLALLALQVGKAEQLAGHDLTGVQVIIEDRGVDSVAAYQAAILCSKHPDTSPESVARQVLTGVRRWRRLPDATILLIGDTPVCVRRFADRIGRPLAPADKRLIEQIDSLYRTLAASDPGRYTVLDTAAMSPADAHRTATEPSLNKIPSAIAPVPLTPETST
jgi:dTMP kinase